MPRSDLAVHRRSAPGYAVTWVFVKIDAKESMLRNQCATMPRPTAGARRPTVPTSGGRYIPPEAIRALARTVPAPPHAPGGTGATAASGKCRH
jgi:hypothetical protein